jgi:hypothetical protein
LRCEPVKLADKLADVVAYALGFEPGVPERRGVIDKVPITIHAFDSPFQHVTDDVRVYQIHRSDFPHTLENHLGYIRLDRKSDIAGSPQIHHHETVNATRKKMPPKRGRQQIDLAV